MYSLFGRFERIGEAKYSAEEICLFRLIDLLLHRGWRFLGCLWNGKKYKIKIKNLRTGKKRSFKSGRPYWLSSDADGNLF